MIRVLVTSTALLFVSFAAQALPPNFDRNLCVKAVFEAGKVTKCVAEAAKARRENGEIYSAVTTCGMYAVPDHRLDCYNYAVEHLDVDRQKILGACNYITKPNFKGTCLMEHLIDEHHEKRTREMEAQKSKKPQQPSRSSGAIH